MTSCDLTGKKCVPCEGGIPALTDEEARTMAQQTPKWRFAAASTPAKIERDWVFKNFVEALAFVNKVGAIAEDEGHHPDLWLHGYKNLRVTLYTHAVSGLTENDFIVAAKIDQL